MPAFGSNDFAGISFLKSTHLHEAEFPHNPVGPRSFGGTTRGYQNPVPRVETSYTSERGYCSGACRMLRRAVEVGRGVDLLQGATHILWCTTPMYVSTQG